MRSCQITRPLIKLAHGQSKKQMCESRLHGFFSRQFNRLHFIAQTSRHFTLTRARLHGTARLTQGRDNAEPPCKGQPAHGLDGAIVKRATDMSRKETEERQIDVEPVAVLQREQMRLNSRRCIKPR